MGTKITSIGTRAPWNSRVLPPVTRNLEGWFELDTDVRRGAYNRAIGKKHGAVVGTPVIAATHMRMSQATGYVQTELMETTELTLFTLGRAVGPFPATVGALLAGTFQGAVNPDLLPGGITATTSFGASMYTDTNGIMWGAATRGNGSGGVTSGGASLAAGTAPTNWAIRVLRATAGQNKVWDKTLGVEAVSANVQPRVPSLAPWRLGSPTGTANNSGAVDLSQAIIYSAALTDEEINEIVTVMRRRATRLGIIA